MPKQIAVRITPEFISEFLKSQEYCVVRGNKIPVDAKLVSFFERIDELTMPVKVFYFIFEHESFSEIQEGERLPILWPELIKK